MYDAMISKIQFVIILRVEFSGLTLIAILILNSLWKGLHSLHTSAQ